MAETPLEQVLRQLESDACCPTEARDTALLLRAIAAVLRDPAMGAEALDRLAARLEGAAHA